MLNPKPYRTHQMERRRPAVRNACICPRVLAHGLWRDKQPKQRRACVYNHTQRLARGTHEDLRQELVAVRVGNAYLFVCVCVCVCLRTCVCMYVRMYGCMDGWMNE